MLNKLKNNLQKEANPKKAKILSKFFKTGKGEYGEGDIFLGITVPIQRKIAKNYKDLPLNELEKLLQSKIHEHRLTALMILIEKYQKSNEKKYYDFYLKNTKFINNWDLIDISSHKIVGNYLLNNSKEKKILYNLAKKDHLWSKRIAIVSTYEFIRNNQFEDTLKISEILLNDKHDLIHKAVGWMLREVGKRDQTTEESFLKKHYKAMPRTMLRYSIERFDKKKKDFYMGK